MIGCPILDAVVSRQGWETKTSTAPTAGAPGPSLLGTEETTNLNRTFKRYTDSVMGTWSNIDYDAEGRLCAVQPIALQGMPVTGYIYDASGTRVATGNLSAWPASCPTPYNNGFTLTSSYVLGLGGEQVTEINGAGGNVLHGIQLGAGIVGAGISVFGNA